MGHILLLIILLILLIEFGLGRWLSYLNIKHSKSKLPAVLADIYDAENMPAAGLFQDEYPLWYVDCIL